MRWYTSFCLTRFCNDRPPCKIRHRYTLCILQGGCGYQHTPAYKTRHKYTLRILTGGGYPYIPEMTPPLAPPPPHPSVRWVCPQRHAALSAHAAGGPSCERRHTYTVGVFTGRGVCIPAPSPPATAEPAEWGFLCPPAHDTHTPLPVRSAIYTPYVSHREGVYISPRYISRRKAYTSARYHRGLLTVPPEDTVPALAIAGLPRGCDERAYPSLSGTP
jgi:hypothetical protein